MLTPTKVCKCGQRIYFIKNPSGKYVPFNVIDKRCHYETCEILKNKQKREKDEYNWKFRAKNKIPYAEQVKNKQLTNFT